MKFHIRIDHFIHHDADDDVITRLERIEQRLTNLTKKEEQFMADMKTELANLATQVQANEDAEASAIVLIEGIADRIIAAQGDPTEVAALAASLKESATKLSAAVVANTPAAP